MLRLFSWFYLTKQMAFVLRSYSLHEHAEYKEECADVLNEEWPRSKSARLHMLEKSNPKLPYSIVLVERNEKEHRVLGHARLCKVHGIPFACFIESVVVGKQLRGKGLGRKLMNEAEEHAKSRLGYRTVYLTTHDKQEFYHKVGYEYCSPVITLGSGSTLLSEEMCNRLFGSLHVADTKSSGPAEKKSQPISVPSMNDGLNCSSSNSDCAVEMPSSARTSCAEPQNSTCSQAQPQSSPLIPPPLHIPPMLQTQPPPPPPPPLPTLLKTSGISQNSSDKVQIMKTSEVFWMKKVLVQ